MGDHTPQLVLSDDLDGMLWRSTLELKLADLVDGTVGSVQWHPALPVGKLKKMKTPDGRKPFVVTKSYLEATRDELRRYYADIERELGSSFKRPIFIEHRIQDAPEELHASTSESAPSGVSVVYNDEGELVSRKRGRRNGDVLDVEVRKFDPQDPKNPESPDAVDWLFVKLDWRPNSLRALIDGELEDISVNIQPKYVDPETGIAYGPFLLEVSETVNPVIKTIDLQSTMDPAVLQAIGLQLAETTEDEGETTMTPEQLEALMSALAQIAETQKQMLELLMAKGDEGEGTETADDKVEAGDDGEDDDPDDEPAPTKTKTKVKVEAGDDGEDDDADDAGEKIAAVLSDFAEGQKKMQKTINAFVKSGALFSDPGGADVGTKPAPKSTLTEQEAWDKAEEEIRKRLPEGAPLPHGKISARSAELLEKGA